MSRVQCRLTDGPATQDFIVQKGTKIERNGHLTMNCLGKLQAFDPAVPYTIVLPSPDNRVVRIIIDGSAPEGMIVFEQPSS